MKTHTLLLTSLALGLLTVGSLQLEVKADEKDGEPAGADSQVKIKMLQGDETITHPPVGGTDPEDENNPGTGNKGVLTIDRVPNINFGEININGSDQAEYAVNTNPYAQVTDVRGSSEGWTLSVKADDFKSANGQFELKGAALSLNDGEAVTASTGNSVTKPVAQSVTLGSSFKPIMSATKGTGEGTWMLSWKNSEVTDENKTNPKIKLAILGGTAKANTEYSTTVYWNLEAAPKGN
ncbi:hypothetical protein DOK67_0002058 [Enterococcus sp. DIV0212c]|uniref:WxL domain-containing protein n=1 Tax=Enterococcus sp. DIV0212c TaxID=2230867 RepID=UPI001A9BA0B5|nr:WxL domain-containing protein [Enterococcus sp. DIV0212c]MBO1354765.1 WxL domain-containing protein [Enterococcus sp. DIV0212c]